MHEAARGTFADQQMTNPTCCGVRVVLRYRARLPPRTHTIVRTAGLSHTAIAAWLSLSGSSFRVATATCAEGVGRLAAAKPRRLRLPPCQRGQLRASTTRTPQRQETCSPAVKTRQPCSCSAVRTDLYQLTQNLSMPPDTIALAPRRAKHRPRFRRVSPQLRPAFRLTDRDRELLKLIYAFRWITADMLQDLAPPVALTPRQQDALARMLAAKRSNSGDGGMPVQSPARTRREILRRLQVLYHYGYVQRKKTFRR